MVRKREGLYTHVKRDVKHSTLEWIHEKKTRKKQMKEWSLEGGGFFAHELFERGFSVQY